MPFLLSRKLFSGEQVSSLGLLHLQGASEKTQLLSLLSLDSGDFVKEGSENRRQSLFNSMDALVSSSLQLLEKAILVTRGPTWVEGGAGGATTCFTGRLAPVGLHVSISTTFFSLTALPLFSSRASFVRDAKDFDMGLCLPWRRRSIFLRSTWAKDLGPACGRDRDWFRRGSRQPRRKLSLCPASSSAPSSPPPLFFLVPVLLATASTAATSSYAPQSGERLRDLPSLRGCASPDAEGLLPPLSLPETPMAAAAVAPAAATMRCPGGLEAASTWSNCLAQQSAASPATPSMSASPPHGESGSTSPMSRSSSTDPLLPPLLSARCPDKGAGVRPPDQPFLSGWCALVLFLLGAYLCARHSDRGEVGWQGGPGLMSDPSGEADLLEPDLDLRAWARAATAAAAVALVVAPRASVRPSVRVPLWPLGKGRPRKTLSAANLRR